MLTYQFMASNKDKYGLTSPADYPYVASLQSIPKMHKAMFDEVIVAFQDVGFTEQVCVRHRTLTTADHDIVKEQHMIFSVLAAILHISNIDFKSSV